MNDQPIQIRFSKSDGALEKLVISQGVCEVSLTPEQADTLAKAIAARIKKSA